MLYVHSYKTLENEHTNPQWQKADQRLLLRGVNSEGWTTTGTGKLLHRSSVSCLENPRDGEAWWAAAHGVAQSRTWRHPWTQVARCYCLVAQLFQLLAAPWMQQTRLPCPLPSPGACSKSCPLNLWCHSAISSSVILFSCTLHMHIYIYIHILCIILYTRFMLYLHTCLYIYYICIYLYRYGRVIFV